MSTKKVIALISFVLIVGFGIYRLDYQDLSFCNNLWQYLMITISLVGSVVIFLFDNETSSTRRKFTVIIWFLSILFFVFIVISSIMRKEFEWLLLLAATLILASTTLSYLGRRKTDKDAS